jgi:hypothetical protein
MCEVRTTYAVRTQATKAKEGGTMGSKRWPWSFALALATILTLLAHALQLSVCAQELPVPSKLKPPSSAPAVALTPPVQTAGEKPLPINLSTALRLANVQAVDIAAAAERIRVAAAVLQQARALWLPTITLGGDYRWCRAFYCGASPRRSRARWRQESLPAARTARSATQE